MEAVKYIPASKVDLEIEDITLLSEDEARKVPKKLRANRKRWWLMTRGFVPTFAEYVDHNGVVDIAGCAVYDCFVGIRPALKVANLRSAHVRIGDAVELAGYRWTVVPGGYALCNACVSAVEFWQEHRPYDYTAFNMCMKQFLTEWANDLGIVIRK